MPKTMSVQNQMPSGFASTLFEHFSMQDIVLLVSALGLTRRHVHEEYRRMLTNLAGKVISLLPHAVGESTVAASGMAGEVSDSLNYSQDISLSLLQIAGAVDGRVSIVLEDAGGPSVEEVVVESPRLRFNGNWQVCSGIEDTPVVGNINQIRIVEIMERSEG
jgi:hypothetical protein